MGDRGYLILPFPFSKPEKPMGAIAPINKHQGRQKSPP
jgi:hypothetical protein